MLSVFTGKSRVGHSREIVDTLHSKYEQSNAAIVFSRRSEHWPIYVIMVVGDALAVLLSKGVS